MQYKNNRRDDYIATVDFVFYHESKIKQAVRERRLDSGSHAGKMTAGRSGYISDPTAQTALHELTQIRYVYVNGRKIDHPEKWLYVIRATYEHLNELQRKVAKSRYRGENYQETCCKLCVSQSTYGRIMTDTRMYAAAVAAQFGLIEIVKNINNG